MPLTDAQKIERRKLIERNRKERAEAERQANIERKRVFAEQRAHFHSIVEWWRDNPGETPGPTMLEICSRILHRRILWDANDAVLFGRDKDGDFRVEGHRIDNLRPSMQLLLGFVKAQHKLEHDERLLESRLAALQTRMAPKEQARQKEKEPESAEQPHAPGTTA